VTGISSARPTVVVQLPAAQRAALARRADREGTTVEDLVVRAVEEWLVWHSNPTAG
jgi:hypothetical protein